MPSDLPYLWAGLARESLGFFGDYVLGYRPAPHHQLWIDVLADEEERRLLIIAPPGHAKTTWLSLILPSWYIGHHPDHHVLLLSGNGDLARDSSKAVRDAVTSARFAQVFGGIEADREKGWSGDSWFLKREGTDPHPTCLGVGIFGAAIGRRANLIVVDDPHDDNTAYSDIRRAHVKRWLHQVVLSRVRPDARVVVILTRWHLDDIAADLISEPEWKVIHLPAIADPALVDPDPMGRKPGEALWPSEWPLPALEQQRRLQGSAIFAAMYQGDPTALGSLVFRDIHFRIWTETDTHYILHRLDDAGAVHEQLVAKSDCWTVQAVDPAITTGKDSDYTVIETCVVTPNGDRLVRDIYREKLSGPDQRNAIVAQYRKHHPVQVGVERVAYQMSLVQDLRRHTGLPIKELKPDKDKRARALRVAALYESEKVFHPAEAPWLADFELELLQFPVGRHDDQVDAHAYACELTDLPAAGLMEYYRRKIAEARAAKGLAPEPEEVSA